VIHLFTKRWTRYPVATHGKIVHVKRAQWAAGAVLNWRAFWIGAHWGSINRRLCVNLLPFVTLWLTFPGGTEP
jgi:hypothetical protein